MTVDIGSCLCLASVGRRRFFGVVSVSSTLAALVSAVCGSRTCLAGGDRCCSSIPSIEMIMESD